MHAFYDRNDSNISRTITKTTEIYYMGKQRTIVLNGVHYDMTTGQRIQDTTAEAAEKQSIETPAGAARRTHTKAASAASAHHTRQKSTTLKRSYIQAPTKKTPAARTTHRTAGRVARSDKIVRFAPRPKPLSQKQRVDGFIPVKHVEHAAPSARATALRQKTAVRAAAPTALSAADIKRGLLAASEQHPAQAPARPSTLQRAAASTKHTAKKSKKPLGTRKLITICLIVALFGGYLTYINMPGLSTRIAAAQAGVNGSYPDYRPDGYRFDGPVSFRPGEIFMKFTGNGGSGDYTITQKQSGWNSVAVLDNLVAKESRGKYNITSEGGVTIYTYDSKAVWSNGGVLYTIDSSNAPLANDQLIRIASSL